MYDWHSLHALIRHPLSSKRRKLYRRRQRNLPLSAELRAFIAQSAPGDSGRFHPGNWRRRHATDPASIVTSDRLSFGGPTDLGVANGFCISLTTTPVRAVSGEIFEVLDSLVAQRRKVRAIFLALPTTYRRAFDVDWRLERPLFVQSVKQRYGGQIEVIDCDDNGPATKLLGLLNHAACGGRLAPNDKIIVVDDDILYADTLVRLHELCHDLYQCDVTIVDQGDLVANRVALEFKPSASIFSDGGESTVYGWLSFALRYDRLSALPQFHSDAVAQVPDAFFHDDAIFSAFIRKSRLYATRINSAPLAPLARARSDSAVGGALRWRPQSHDEVRRGVERQLERLAPKPAEDDDAAFTVRPDIPPRELRNCSGLSFHGSDGALHFAAHCLADDRLVVTVTVFEPGLVGSDAEIRFSVDADDFRLPLRLESRKFSVVAQVHRPVFRSLSDHADPPIMQTNSTAIVSRNKFYSVCTILNNAPTHRYVFFDRPASLAYIETFFSEIIAKCYNSLIPGAYKADLLRYAFAYLNACIYFDTKMILNAPVSAVYHLSHGDHVFVADQNPDHICNAFFISRRAKTNVFKNVILLCADRIAANDYGDDSLCVTGPGVLGAAAFHEGHFTPGLFKQNRGEDWRNGVICDQWGVEFVFSSYPGYYEENDYENTSHYGVLWRSRKVFRDPPSSFWGDCQAVLRGVDRILWISLARALPRRRHMEALLERFPATPHTRVEAVDGGEALPLAEGSERDRNASAYEIACCLSHLKALDEAAALSGDVFLILEDDASLRFFPFLGPRDAIENIVSRAPADWDAIQLWWIHERKFDRDFTNWNACLDDGTPIAGSVAYLVNRSALEKIKCAFERRKDTFYIRPTSKRRALAILNNKWLVSDIFIFSNLVTYTYRNRVFVPANTSSFIHPNHLGLHKAATNIMFNSVDEDILLRPRPGLGAEAVR